MVELTGATFGGEALGHLPDGRVVFVPRGLPGESVLAHITQDRRDFARAELVSVERTVNGRVDPPCPYYGLDCGGCSWQHADYAMQLELKHRVVVDQLRRIGHFTSADELVRPPIGMLQPWNYRNQARFTVGRRFGELCFTFRSSHRLMRIDHRLFLPANNEKLGLRSQRILRLGLANSLVQHLLCFGATVQGN